jgi:hypothetical protein
MLRRDWEVVISLALRLLSESMVAKCGREQASLGNSHLRIPSCCDLLMRIEQRDFSQLDQLNSTAKTIHAKCAIDFPLRSYLHFLSSTPSLITTTNPTSFSTCNLSQRGTDLAIRSYLQKRCTTALLAQNCCPKCRTAKLHRRGLTPSIQSQSQRSNFLSRAFLPLDPV